MKDKLRTAYHHLSFYAWNHRRKYGKQPELDRVLKILRQAAGIARSTSRVR